MTDQLLYVELLLFNFNGLFDSKSSKIYLDRIKCGQKIYLN